MRIEGARRPLASSMDYVLGLRNTGGSVKSRWHADRRGVITRLQRR